MGSNTDTEEEVPRKRRKIDVGGMPAGVVNSTPERRMALLLRNTYEIERRRHENQRKSDEQAYDPGRFDKDLGQLGYERRASVTDNVEDNPGHDPGDGPGMARAGAKLVWRQIARHLIEKHVDPEAFIRAQFVVMPDGGRTPPPEAFLNFSKSMARYKAAKRIAEQEIVTAFKFQQSKFRTTALVARRSHLIKTDEEAWAAVLEDEETELSALFRYCLALTTSMSKTTGDRPRFRQIAAYYKLAAALQYISSADQYDEVWKNWIPEGFREQASEAYRAFYGAENETDPL
jgi:hypothetical protein